MRDIRFRAWDGDEMLEWTDMLKHKGVMWSVLGGTTVTRFQHQYDTVGETLPMYEVMQFTGLQDSQGVDIYEGDILTPHYYQNTSKFNLTVVFQEGCFMFDICAPYIVRPTPIYRAQRTASKANNEYIIIGNIYEDNHLLVSK